MDLTNSGETRRVGNEWYVPSVNVQGMNARMCDAIDRLSLSSLGHMEIVVLFYEFHFRIVKGWNHREMRSEREWQRPSYSWTTERTVEFPYRNAWSAKGMYFGWTECLCVERNRIVKRGAASHSSVRGITGSLCCRCKGDDLEELEEVDLSYLITDTITVKYDTIPGVSILYSTDWEVVGP